MYEYLQGKVSQINPGYVTLDVQGAGFLIYMANPYRFQTDKEYRIYVYQSVSENDISLYGFKSRSDKMVFLNLISVKGIGPKSALAILANEDYDGLVSAINNNDVNYLKKFPKIGPKAAQQIILDLKGKIDDIESDHNINLKPLEEAKEALLALGYSNKEVQNVAKILKTESHDTVDDYIRSGLKLLTKH